MTRTVLVTACGLFAGFPVGALAVVTLVAGNAYDDRARGFVAAGEPTYPTEVLSALGEVPLLAWAVAGVVGAANGAVGAGHGRRSGARRLWPVAWLPLLILLLPFVECPRPPAGPGVLVIVALFLAPFVWVAGQVGQRIGVAGRHRG